MAETISRQARAGPAAMVEALAAATNAHELDALAECFTDDYVNETPVHPARGFRGRDQVRKNWEQIFAGIPDVTATVLQMVVDGDTVWSEWEMRGTRLDGVAHVMRGVILFTVEGTRARAARFYLEPVDPDAGGVDDAVRRAAGPS